MNALEIMVSEHANIKRMLKIVRKYCYKVLKNEALDYNDFYKIIDFVRNYADKHHHSKEENILFDILSNQFGEKIKNGPIMGMLVEHDLGRLYMTNLENALKRLEAGKEDAKLDIIANSISYTDLLTRHIDREDTALYKFAERSLSEENVKMLNEKSEEVEKNAALNNIQDKYLKLINELERKLDAI
ncbi:hemerythrin [Clostridium carboxidivorans P7]|uniref:Hemerythrin HHE cation binding domain protein n=1 Tax=Clostridium carboxidivorans P7 TaxID=536227 RepID=C6PNA2_9CLOT|nr:hemerythrin domain-containing protein [Clostridium carboxidivorans]AKN33609.1 hemerythrin [Clostridium carboxidivorans P7]EET89223.1 Hemerythrin HHE cation binding domain protein [Clostridium carboxidivorans P7]EFG86802.1 hemerythrin HHE cation binding domain protein [Clostridium carboxidivorans P7]